MGNSGVMALCVGVEGGLLGHAGLGDELRLDVLEGDGKADRLGRKEVELGGDTSHSLSGRGAIGDPVQEARDIQAHMLATERVGVGVVVAEKLNVLTVAAGVVVGDDDAVDSLVAAAAALEADAHVREVGHGGGSDGSGS